MQCSMKSLTDNIVVEVHIYIIWNNIIFTSASVQS